MTASQVTQRLVAILAADVYGYSRLMQDDAQATVATLDASRQVFRDHIVVHQGRVVDTAGDAVLAVFETAIGAAEAAMRIQAALTDRNTQLLEHRQMLFRIGVHLGDVIEKPDGTVYGDGVNIAARLESLANPGSVVVSGIVHDVVVRRLQAGFESLGEHSVKNITEPVRAYRIRGEDETAAPGPPPQAQVSGGPTQIICASALFHHVLAQARAVAATDATVLIEGESGVGKELVARHIHEHSRRHQGPFVKVDCASMPPERFESEFFGQAAGASPGVLREHAGRLEQAARGTVFLDQVEEIPPALQGKLLRPLQDATFERVGDGRTRRADVRFIAATNRDLADKVAAGGFRRDLYFRLSVFPIKVPPLRDRPEDIPVLVQHFLAAHAAIDTAAPCVTPAQVEHLQKYDWPGNVRELQNLVERALILSGNGLLRLEEVLPRSAISYPARAYLAEEHTPARGFFRAAEFEELERNNLVAALEIAGWHVAGREGAAAQLGLTGAKLRSRMRALAISRPKPDSLYVRLGGSRGIATIVRDLFGRAVAHPVLGRFWKGRSTYGVLREEKLLVAYLSAAAGGPAHYVGRDMKAAHQHLDISREDWELLETLLSTTFAALSVPETEQREVIAFIESLRDEIVKS
jgi:DNA-binding NtrC family response regulator/truncated hemoglobin YjbI